MGYKLDPETLARRKAFYADWNAKHRVRPIGTAASKRAAEEKKREYQKAYQENYRRRRKS